ncbi:hypothetical protein BDQ12DRAFT_712386 [Crucibulum laeve]|uniref:Uncharacterized protein n=1 Tax=Crucibulum laeve TaxID=68775 RepID=A0A5C3M3Z9_9AGAR|nr:hypothetical protein BDQ12DRAFT_712386 [Crucibulum laeve]
MNPSRFRRNLPPSICTLHRQAMSSAISLTGDLIDVVIKLLSDDVMALRGYSVVSCSFEAPSRKLLFREIHIEALSFRSSDRERELLKQENLYRALHPAYGVPVVGIRTEFESALILKIRSPELVSITLRKIRPFPICHLQGQRLLFGWLGSDGLIKHSDNLVLDDVKHLTIHTGSHPELKLNEKVIWQYVELCDSSLEAFDLVIKVEHLEMLNESCPFTFSDLSHLQRFSITLPKIESFEWNRGILNVHFVKMFPTLRYIFSSILSTTYITEIYITVGPFPRIDDDDDDEERTKMKTKQKRGQKVATMADLSTQRTKLDNLLASHELPGLKTASIAY